MSHFHPGYYCLFDKFSFFRLNLKQCKDFLTDYSLILVMSFSYFLSKEHKLFFYIIFFYVLHLFRSSAIMALHNFHFFVVMSKLQFLPPPHKPCSINCLQIVPSLFPCPINCLKIVSSLFLCPTSVHYFLALSMSPSRIVSLLKKYFIVQHITYLISFTNDLYSLRYADFK